MQVKQVQRLEEKVDHYEHLITDLRNQVSDLVDQIYVLKAENKKLAAPKT